MKKVFLLLLCLVSINKKMVAQLTETDITSAKRTNNLQMGLHLMNLEDDKFALDYLKVEYQKDISRHSAFTTSIGFASYTKHYNSKLYPDLDLPEEREEGFVKDNNHSSLIMFNVNYAYRFYPFKRGNMIVKVGPTVSYLIETRFFSGSAQIGFRPDGTYAYQYSSYSLFQKSYDYGINFVVGYNVDLSKKVNMVTYMNHQKYLGNINPYVYALGVGVGYKF